MDSSTYRRCHTLFRHGKPIQNLHSSNCLLSKSFFQHFENFCDFFISLKKIWCRRAVFSSLPLSIYTKIAGGTTHTCTEHNIAQKSLVLLPYSMQQMTQQTLLQLHIAVEISASSSSVILWWVRNHFDCTTIKPMSCNVKVCGVHIKVFP